jgi:hypothetical protein
LFSSSLWIITKTTLKTTLKTTTTAFEHPRMILFKEYIWLVAVLSGSGGGIEKLSMGRT